MVDKTSDPVADARARSAARRLFIKEQNRAQEAHLAALREQREKRAPRLSAKQKEAQYAKACAAFDEEQRAIRRAYGFE